MNIPVETKPTLWGIAIGAVAVAIIGFSWGGWVTSSRAQTDASTGAKVAVVNALTPICVERFQHAVDFPANSAALKKADSWSRGDLVEKGGWATMPGPANPEQVSAVAKSCAEVLAG
jgi:alpha/beta superfamily hydrolase